MYSGTSRGGKRSEYEGNVQSVQERNVMGMDSFCRTWNNQKNCSRMCCVLFQIPIPLGANCMFELFSFLFFFVKIYFVQC